MNNRLSEGEILSGIRVRDRKVLRYVYDQYFVMIRDFVYKNSGTEDDARDLFQEGMIVIFEQTHAQELQLRSSFKTYLYAICRNKWLMQLRKKRSGPQFVVDTAEIDIPGDDTERIWLLHERYELLRSHFKKMGEDCREVMSMFFRGHSLKEIADHMGYSDKYAKKRKFQCQKRLVESIESDEMYGELLNE